MTTTATTTTGQFSPAGSLPITPDFQMQALRTIAGQGAAEAFSPYQGYSGPRIADLTPDQLNAQQMTRDVSGATVVNPGQISSAINYGLSGFDPNEVNKYMSPYTSGVVNEIGRLGNQNLFQNILPQVNTTFQGAGQFGSTRNADFTNQAIQSNQATTLGQQATALEAGYKGALDNYNTWHQNALPNAAAAASLETQGANNLNNVGQQNQAQTQKSYDLAYNDFQNQKNYPMQQLGWYNNLIQGQNMPNASSSPVFDQTTAPSPLAQGLATFGNVYGTFKAAGG